MAIVVLVLWLFTAGAGFYLLVTSNLGRARPAATTPAAEPATAPAEPATAPAAAGGSASQAASKREMRRAARDRFDPPSLTAAKNAPAVPGLRSLLEFAHPAFAIVGLGFWLGFTLVHDRGAGLDRVRAGDSSRLPGTDLVHGQHARGQARGAIRG